MPVPASHDNMARDPSPAHCPLCGGPNGCAQVAGTAAGQRCWCCDVRIARETLDQIPAALRNVACLCQKCTTGEANATPS